MASLNKVLLIGNLGKDPELRTTPGGQSVCNFSMAMTDRWNDQTGQRKEKTEWMNIVVWGKQGENCAQYLAKGRPVFVEGSFQTRTYDKDGQKHYMTEVVANRVQFLGQAPQARSPRPGLNPDDQPWSAPPDPSDDIPF